MGLHPKETIFNKRMGIEPLLLNSGDSITVKILNIDTTDKKIVVDVQGRIVEIKEILEKKLDNRKHTSSDIVFTILVFLGFLLIFSGLILFIILPDYILTTFQYFSPIFTTIVMVSVAMMIKMYVYKRQ